jgi:hypothetical protein
MLLSSNNSTENAPGQRKDWRSLGINLGTRAQDWETMKGK